MTEERWQETIDKLAERFGQIERSEESLAEGHGKIEQVVFHGPLGTLRLERTTHDRIIGEKTMTSKRIGGDVAISKMYDSSERVDYLKLARLNETNGAWEELDAKQLGVGE